MNTSDIANPYSDPVKREFWEICVRRDLEAFLAADWSITADDFCASDFLGVDANGSLDPLQWTPAYSSLEAYKKEFELQAADFGRKSFSTDIRGDLYNLLSLSDPEINEDRALIVKTFDGSVSELDGTTTDMKWQSVFHFRNVDTRWLITGFVGYLPLVS